MTPLRATRHHFVRFRILNTYSNRPSPKTRMAVITAFDVSIGLNLRGLRALKNILAKTSSHHATAAATSTKSTQDLSFHVQCCVNLATQGLGLLTRTEQEPSVWNSETTLPALESRVDSAIELLENGANPEDLNGVEDRSLEVTYGNGGTAAWGGKEYILGYSIPNFMFHLCMVYSTLKNQGVEVGKMDYLTPFMEGMTPAP